MKIQEKNVFYRPDKIRSYNAFINFIVGARGVGKTFSLTETVINDYLKTGKQFLYIRRRVTELEDISKFFDDMIYHEKFEGHTLTVEPDKRGATFKIDGEVCGYARALSVQHYLKSVPFPLIYNILFDEFIIDVGGLSRVTYTPTNLEVGKETVIPYPVSDMYLSNTTVLSFVQRSVNNVESVVSYQKANGGIVFTPNSTNVHILVIMGSID